MGPLQGGGEGEWLNEVVKTAVVCELKLRGGGG